MSTQGTRADSTRLRKLLIAVAAAGLLLGAVFWLTQGDSHDATVEAAPNVTLEFFNGTSRELSEFRGKPIVLNFWASWYPACIGEVPAFG